MTPERRDEFVTAILQAAVNWLPDEFDQLWIVIEEEEGVGSQSLLFTSPSGPWRAFPADDPELDEALDDLIEASIADGQPIHRAVLSHLSSGGASADFDYEPLPGGVIDGSDARMDEFALAHLGRSWTDIPEFKA